MDKHRQMAVKVVHLSIPLLEGDLGVDVCDSCRKDRQLYLWHAKNCCHIREKKQPSFPLQPEPNRLISLPLPTYIPPRGIRGSEVKNSFWCPSSSRLREARLRRGQPSVFFTPRTGAPKRSDGGLVLE